MARCGAREFATDVTPDGVAEAVPFYPFTSRVAPVDARQNGNAYYNKCHPGRA